jgi:hypothetical protein
MFRDMVLGTELIVVYSNGWSGVGWLVLDGLIYMLILLFPLLDVLGRLVDRSQMLHVTVMIVTKIPHAHRLEAMVKSRSPFERHCGRLSSLQYVFWGRWVHIR